MTEFIIIRHGYSQSNKDKTFAGQTDVALDEIGYKQAEATKKYVAANFSIDKIYSSDLSRAYNTAKPLADALDLKINIRDDLSEINVGLWQGKTHEEIRAQFPESYEIYKNNLRNAAFEGGESYCDVIFRVKKAISEIAAENEGKTVAVVTHGGIIQVMQLAWNASPTASVSSIVSNCSVSLANYTADILTFTQTGYEGHLKNLSTKWHNI